MRILFMGTPDFAEASLQRLYDDGCDIVGVFTQPDKPKNRGMKLTACPVKQLAMEKETPVFQPEKLRDGQAMEIVQKLNPELIVVVAYGKMIPNDIIDYPQYGCINIHGSLLPKYRGSAPIQWAVLNGEKVTGVTAMYIAEQMDAGDIIAYKETKIKTNETSGELFDRLKMLGAELLSQTIHSISDGTVKRVPQQHENATYAPPISKDMCPIDWTKSCDEIQNHICGLLPWPVATTYINGTICKIFCVSTDRNVCEQLPGTLLSADKNGIAFACKDGVVTILELQAPGGKRMKAADYLRGHPICL